MDLVAAVPRVVVVIDHCEKGDSKFKKACSLLLTGKGVVDRLSSELCVFEIDRKGSGARLIGLVQGVHLAEVKSTTEAT